MKIVDLKQNSRDWYEWRKQGIGASEAPAVMGVSPWSTPFQLWAKKTGKWEEPPPNEFAAAAMRRGNELEPVVRDMFNARGVAYNPLSASHDTHLFIRASLDGWNEETKTFIEIKCPNKKDHSGAVAGKVPEKYFPQLQQQFLVTGAQKAFYVSWDGRSAELAMVPVFPDQVYQEKLLGALKAFWGYMSLDVPPPSSPEDLEVVASILADATKRLNSAVSLFTQITKKT